MGDETLFHLALEKPCGGDSGLRHPLEEFLRSHNISGKIEPY